MTPPKPPTRMPRRPAAWKRLASLGLTALLVASAALVTATGSVNCNDIDIQYDPEGPTSGDVVYIVVSGVANAEVEAQWSITDAQGNLVEAGASDRAANSNDVFRAGPLGPYERDDVVESQVNADFGLVGSCTGVAGPVHAIRNSVASGTITYEPVTPVRGEAVRLQAIDVDDVDGDAVALRWLVDGEPVGTGAHHETRFQDLESHEVTLILDDGFAETTVTQVLQAVNQPPVIDDLRVEPSAVIRGQEFSLSWTMSDADPMDTLHASALLDGDLVEPAGPYLTHAFATADQDQDLKPLVAQASDGIETIEETIQVTVYDRLAPDLAIEEAAPAASAMQVLPGDGEPSRTKNGGILYHTYPASDQAGLIAALAFAEANNVQLVSLYPPLPAASDALHDAVKAATEAGVLIIVPAGAGDGSPFAIRGVAAYPEVLTVATPGFSGRGPTPDLVAKPEVSAPAGDPVQALAYVEEQALALWAKGIRDPMAVRALLRASAGDGERFVTGAGVPTLPVETPVLPAIPATSYLDFGVVNDRAAASTELSFVNLNGLQVHLAGMFDGSLPGEAVQVNIQSTFHYFPDILDHGFQVLADEAAAGDIPTYALTDPATFQVQPTEVRVEHALADLVPFVEETASLLQDLEPLLGNNNFDTGLDLAGWDTLDAHARTIRDARVGLENLDPDAAEDNVDTIRTEAQAVCDFLRTDALCQSAALIDEQGQRVIDHLNHQINSVEIVGDLDTVTYETDPDKTLAAPRGLYIGYTTIQSESAAGELLPPYHIPSAALITGTTIIDVQYRDGSPVANTTVEAEGDSWVNLPSLAANLAESNDHLSSLFVSMPVGYHVKTDTAGRATLPHLSPLWDMPWLGLPDRWQLGAYYDAPLDFDVETGDESIPSMLGVSDFYNAFGPTMTALAQAKGFELADSVAGLVLANVDPPQLPPIPVVGELPQIPPELHGDSYAAGRALLERDHREQFRFTIPTTIYHRVVDTVMGADWQTGTGQLSGATDLVEGFSSDQAGWTWTKDGSTLEGTNSFGVGPGLARYAFPLPDAEYLRFSIDAEVGEETRGVPVLFSTFSKSASERLDAFLATLEDGSPGDALSGVSQLASLRDFIESSSSDAMIRVIPLESKAASLQVGWWDIDIGIDVAPGALADAAFGVEHGLATEFIMEGEETDEARLTLLVLPIGPAELRSGMTIADQMSTQAILGGGHIVLDVSTRVHGLEIEDAGQESLADYRNPAASSMAETWDTFVSLPHGQTALANEQPLPGASILQPGARQDVRMGYDGALLQPWWNPADALDQPRMRAFSQVAGENLQVVEFMEETTCMYNLDLVAMLREPRNMPDEVAEDGTALCLSLDASALETPVTTPDYLAAPWGSDTLRIHRQLTDWFTELDGVIPEVSLGALPGVDAADSYISRWQPQPIEAAGANHQFLWLPTETNQQLDAWVELQTTTGTLEQAAYPPRVAPWEHEHNPPRPWLDWDLS